MEAELDCKQCTAVIETNTRIERKSDILAG